MLDDLPPEADQKTPNTIPRFRMQPYTLMQISALSPLNDAARADLYRTVVKEQPLLLTSIRQ